MFNINKISNHPDFQKYISDIGNAASLIWKVKLNSTENKVFLKSGLSFLLT